MKNIIIFVYKNQVPQCVRKVQSRVLDIACHNVDFAIKFQVKMFNGHLNFQIHLNKQKSQRENSASNSGLISSILQWH